MDLYILRHGQTTSTSSEGRTHNRLMVTNRTNERSLTFEGKVEVERVGQAFAMLNIKPDAIITSPLKRSYQAAEIIDSILFSNKNKKSRKSQQISRFQIWNDLTPEGDIAKVLEKLSRFKYDSKILIVGHEPFLSKMICEVLNNAAHINIGGTSGGFSSDSRRRHNQSPHATLFLNNVERGIVLKKSGFAKLRISAKGQRLTGELRWLLTPKLLRKMSQPKKKNKVRSSANLNAVTEIVSSLRV